MSATFQAVNWGEDGSTGKLCLFAMAANASKKIRPHSSASDGGGISLFSAQLIVTAEEALEQWPEIGPLLDGRYQLAHEAYPDKVYIHR